MSTSASTLRELIDLRLKIRRPETNEFMRDDVFYWRSAMRGLHVPSEIEQRAAVLFEKRDFDKAEALFSCLFTASTTMPRATTTSASSRWTP